MANIRSYKNFRVKLNDGTVVIDSAFSSPWIKGIRICLDDKSIVNKTTMRYICSCGHVFDGECGEKCPNCSNTEWIGIRIGGRYYYSGRWMSDGTAYYNIPEIVNGYLVVPMLSVSWDKPAGRFDIKENYYDLISVDSAGFYHLQSPTNTDQDTLMKLFDQWIDSIPVWEPVKVMENIYPYKKIQERLGVEENYAYTMISLYNMMHSVPNVSTLSEDMFFALMDRMRTVSNKVYKSLIDFYKDAKIPLAFSDIYPITGLPTDTMEKIDKLDPVVLKVMSYSLTHKHTTFRDIANMVRNDEHVDSINANPEEFAEFFRKNVIKFAGDTLEAFLYIDGNATIKDANIKKFINYCGKKNIKKDKIEKFYNHMYDGNAIKALESLL